MGTNTKNTQNKFDYHQVLFSWFSPNFPIGSFNFSHGLEAAVEMKFIHDSFTLENWISNLITDGSGKTDVILLSNAYRGKNINELALALCPSKERWIESIKLGKSIKLQGLPPVHHLSQFSHQWLLLEVNPCYRFLLFLF